MAPLIGWDILALAYWGWAVIIATSINLVSGLAK